MRLLSCILFFGASRGDAPSWNSGPTLRRLIINGEPKPIEDYPFVVSLLICSITTDGKAKANSCSQFCTGALISQDVVLTAGHCVIDDSTPFNVQRPLADLKRIRVLLGASNYKDRPDGSRLVKVRDFANAGYNTNYHHPMDDDVGLLFLDSCLSPKTWPFAQVSTPATSLDDGCQRIELAGWGKHKAVPDLLYKSNGQLNGYADRLLPYRVCRESYVAMHKDRVPRGLRRVIPTKELYDTISPDRHLCHGGATIKGTCFGDSGGPLIVRPDERSAPVVVGVTSFGIGDTCSGGPSFAARVSTYAPWIESMIKAKSACKYDVSKIFTTYPLTERPQSPTDRTGRCGEGKWQCQYSGTCIDLRNVCDGYPQCDDESDEDASVCLGEYSASNIESLPPPIELVAGIMGLGIGYAPEEMQSDGMEMDEDDAIESESQDEESDAQSIEADPDAWMHFGLEDIVEEGVYLNTRAYSKWREVNEPLLIAYSECPAVYALLNHIREERCVSEYQALVANIKRVGTNPRGIPKYLLDSCDTMNACIGQPGTKFLVSWIKHCRKAPHSRLSPPKFVTSAMEPQLKFCQKLRTFGEEEAERVAKVDAFNKAYGAVCPAP